MVGSVAASQPTTPPPPIEAYGQLPGLDQVIISPDGQRLAFIGQVGEHRRLGVKGLNGQDLANVELGSAKIRYISWLDSSHIVIVRSTTTDKFSEFGDLIEAFNGQIYNVDTRQFANVLDSARGVSSSRTGDDTVYNLFSSYYVREIDGKRTMLVTAAKSGDNLLFRIDPDNGRATPFLRNYTGGLLDENARVYADSEIDFDLGRFRVVAFDGVNRREVFNWDGGRGVVSWPSLLGAGRRPGTVIISVPVGVDKDEELWELSLADGAKKKLTFPGGLQMDPIYDDVTGRLLGFGGMRGNAYERIYTDEAAARAWATLEASFTNGFFFVQSRTPDYSKIVVRTEGDNDSGTFLLIDVAAGKAIKVGSAYPGVPGSAVNERRWITYKAADGLDIPAYLTLPRGRDPRNLPLIVLPHGGPASRDEPGFDWWSQALASRGYAVLQPQFRGSSGFGEAHMAAGYGQWGKKMQTDLSDGVRYLAAQGIIDPRRVCITGWSYGGYAAAAAVALDPGVYRCSAAGAGVYDMRAMIFWANGESNSADTPTGRYWKQNMGASRIGDTGLDEVSAARHVDRITVPLLLMHGVNDTVVPMKQTDLMEAAMRRAGKPVTVVRLEGEDHWLSTGATRTRMLQESIRFLEANNPPYP
ncbi:MAG: prolyl oligopeptidase family serine peptidase [Caulobacteraceae bacterium]|nr:prolyl oligopeptidase family serine peptidase [Caulobacteraceae bacterium]